LGRKRCFPIGSQTPKNEILGMGISSVNDKNSNAYNFNTCCADHDEIFTWNSHQEWVFVGGVMDLLVEVMGSTNKSRMADGAILNFVICI